MDDDEENYDGDDVNGGDDDVGQTCQRGATDSRGRAAFRAHQHAF